MDRRHAVAALAFVALAPGAALAQKAKNSRMDSAEAMGEAEKRHGAMTLAVGMVAMETSKIARHKAQNAWVKKFAEFEVAEQETIAEVLKSNGAIPAKMNEKHAAMVKKLQDAQAGPAFDQEYMTGQLEGHRELLKIQEDYLSEGKNKHHMDVTKVARGQIKEHIDMIQTIQKDIKSA